VEETCTRQEVFDAHDRVKRTRKAWLQWLVTFAQSPLDALSPTEVRTWKIGLLALQLSPGGRGIGFDDNTAVLPTDQELAAIHRLLHDAVRNILAKRPAYLGIVKADRTILFDGDLPYVSDLPLADEYSYEQLVRDAFVRLLEGVCERWKEAGHTQPFLKSCPAPKPHRREPCGTWFIGRQDQRHCSPQCQTRERTRQWRQKTRPHRGAHLTSANG
jgi:hypothetical protein